MEQPLVSIIVPVYNTEKRLSRCIGSICAQTWQNLEILLLNDGSTDGSLAVCEEFRARDPRIRVIDKENTGVSDTRNVGLGLARGKYIQFSDSDDYLDPDCTRRLAEAAEANEADLVVAPYRMVIARGMSFARGLQEKIAPTQKDEPPAEDPGAEPEIREYGFLPAGLLTREEYALALMKKPGSFYYGALWNKLYRREVLEGGPVRFVEDVPWGEDFVFNVQVIRRAERFFAIETPGYYYVQNAQGLCHTQINPMTVIQGKSLLFPYYKELYEELGLYEEKRVEIYKYLVEMSESVFSTGPFQKLVTDVKEIFRDILPEGAPSPEDDSGPAPQN